MPVTRVCIGHRRREAHAGFVARQRRLGLALVFERDREVEVQQRLAGAALQALAVFDFAANLCKQCMVLAHGHIGAGMHFSAALPHQNISWKHDLAAIALDAQTLTVRVASVA